MHAPSQAAARLGAQVVELHTGAYCDRALEDDAGGLARELDQARARGATPRRRQASRCMPATGSPSTPSARVARIAEVVELNIGHFLVGEAIFGGLGAAIARMRALMDEARAGVAPPRQARQGGTVILGLGNDIIDIRRIEKTIERYRRALPGPCLHRHGAREIGRPGRPRRLLRQALRRQGSLRQSPGNRVQEGRVLARHGRRSTCARAGPPWC